MECVHRSPHSQLLLSCKTKLPVPRIHICFSSRDHFFTSSFLLQISTRIYFRFDIDLEVRLNTVKKFENNYNIGIGSFYAQTVWKIKNICVGNLVRVPKKILIIVKLLQSVVKINCTCDQFVRVLFLELM